MHCYTTFANDLYLIILFVELCFSWMLPTLFSMQIELCKVFNPLSVSHEYVMYGFLFIKDEKCEQIRYGLYL